MTLLKAIAAMEGFNVIGSRPNRNNNPGDIEYGPFAIANGSDGIETIPPGHNITPRFAHFPTPEIGFAALYALLSGPHYAGLTIEEAINKYAPPIENATVDYVSFVCKQVGCSSNDLVSEVLAQ